MSRGKCAQLASRAVIDSYRQTGSLQQKMFTVSGQKKVTLKTRQLEPLISKAQSSELPMSVVNDDKNEPTILVLGPAANNNIDEITGSLKLFK